MKNFFSKKSKFRPESEVKLEYTNLCAAYGAAHRRITTLDQDIGKMNVRLLELEKELDAARERQAKEKPADVVSMSKEMPHESA